MLSFNSAFFNQSTLYSQSIKPMVQPSVTGQEKLDQDQFAYQRLGDGLKKNADVDLANDKTVNESTKAFDVDAVIDTVMKQVDKRIQEAKAGGASDKELESMFDAARSGVEKGFGQAREQIEALNKMNEPLAEKIDSAEKGIMDGIDELQSLMFEGDKQGNSTNQVDGQRVEYAKTFQSERNDFSFQLKTREGDVVTIRALSESQSSGQFMRADSKEGGMSYQSVSSSSRSGYSFEVKGDINDKEMQAIDDLMAQVNDLSTEFYSGDIGRAFDMAMELTSDPKQIAEFSLNLKQQQTRAVEYGAGAISNYEKPVLPKGLADPLANFAQGVKDAFEQANQFANGKDLLTQLTENMQANSQNGQSNMLDAMEPMLEKLAA
ncbi:DUF5610 domain-containing protein [Bermanella sp. R86510]|uniref:DUF5610 domain-containing protein n=1 Tax=unclassified Bermanella TaxID=2627862 RepID=UPI0037CBFC31